MDDLTIPEFCAGGYRESFIVKMGFKFQGNISQCSNYFMKNYTTGKCVSDYMTFRNGMYNCLLENIEVMIDKTISMYPGSERKNLNREEIKEMYLIYIEEFKNYYLKIYRLFNEEELEDMKHRTTELEKENQELKDLVYSSLDQINDLKENKSFLFQELQEIKKENQELKLSFDDSLHELEEGSLDNLGEQIISLLEHNKSLSSRVLDLESLFETKQVPNLIEM